ncbi:COX aromatic rich motif-containing protein [Parendozoicomonas haliclonae]|uniref:Ubiquinol oxidase subunit 2 n=1 Tax=Parendozoicomonas haliclonae TaxID=1960125 RepID=A0A1X7AKD8_9GAMM|nr:COX aromatic rich motif-containing protein [Parendozoicomonas haliclonae]SMA46989.1 Cytochrome bo(3) ubiquinol oxidase subunit 2 precursor [Parendozoicomonas haliclonae]
MARLFIRSLTSAPLLHLYGLMMLCGLVVLSGCSLQSSPLLYPKGPVASTERELMLFAIAIMLTVLIPVWGLTLWCCRRYRKGGKGEYRPDWCSSTLVECGVWGGPLIIILLIGYLVVVYTFRLDPYKPLTVHSTDTTPFPVQAVALDWKWLFIYPELGIATVNELVFPQSRPLALEITSDTVMTSFMIPALGGQIYAMAGMTTHLNLIADQPGTFTGRNTQFSGTGFPQMYFSAKALPDKAFEDWLGTVRNASSMLNSAHYHQLARPNKSYAPVEYFSSVDTDLFNHILARYSAPSTALANGAL